MPSSRSFTAAIVPRPPLPARDAISESARRPTYGQTQALHRNSRERQAERHDGLFARLGDRCYFETAWIGDVAEEAVATMPDQLFVFILIGFFAQIATAGSARLSAFHEQPSCLPSASRFGTYLTELFEVGASEQAASRTEIHRGGGSVVYTGPLGGTALRFLEGLVRGDFVVRGLRAPVLSETSFDVVASSKDAQLFRTPPCAASGRRACLCLPRFVHRRFRSGGGANGIFVRNFLLGLAPMIFMAPLWSSFTLPDCLSSLTDAFLPVTGLVQQRVRAFLETIGQLRH